MKITIFTSNQPRHMSLVRALAKISDECHVIVESNTVFPGQVPGFFKKSDVFQEYFSQVIAAEKAIFGGLDFYGDVQTLTVQSGDLNKLERSTLEPALNSDVYIVFGSSFIKGWLIEHLVANRAVNIHMGISPYYRGSSCNFWALYDGNPHMVGATIHLLSKGLDSGKMLYHAAPSVKGCSNPFEFTMMTVKAAQESLVERIADGSFLNFKPIKQDRSLEVRYTRNADFTDEIARDFMDQNLTMDKIAAQIEAKKDGVDYLRPFFL